MPNSLPTPRSASPVPQRRPVRLRRRILTVTSLGLAGLLAGLLSGCAGSATGSSGTVVSYALLAGNWGFTADTVSSSGSRLTLGGSLAVSGAQASGSQVSGILHALTPGQCLSQSDFIPVSGSVDATGNLTLSGASATGAAVSITGIVSDDRQSLDNPSVSATGGACPTPALRHTAVAPRDGTGGTAQQFQPVTGTYNGTFVTADGQSFAFTTTVTQLDQPDSSGVYHIQGSATSAGNTCLPGTVPAIASSLSGGALTTTYTDQAGTTSITASGSASIDGGTLTLTNWSLTSPCGSDSGTATLTRQ